MSLNREDLEAIERSIKKRDSTVTKVIVVAAVVIAVSNLVAIGIPFLRAPGGPLAAPTPQPRSTPVAQQSAQATPSNVSIELGHLQAMGSDTAKIGIVEFADFRCPYCQQFSAQAAPQIIKDYVDTGKAKFAFRQFAFLGPASVLAGNAAECANEQGKFWVYHDWLYANQPPEVDTAIYSTERLSQVATDLGLDSEQFHQCLDAKKYNLNVNTDQADGATAGVNGTPSFIVGRLDPSGTRIVDGVLLAGAVPYTTFKTSLDRVLD